MDGTARHGISCAAASKAARQWHPAGPQRALRCISLLLLPISDAPESSACRAVPSAALQSTAASEARPAAAGLPAARRLAAHSRPAPAPLQPAQRARPGPAALGGTLRLSLLRRDPCVPERSACWPQKSQTPAWAGIFRGGAMKNAMKHGGQTLGMHSKKLADAYTREGACSTLDAVDNPAVHRTSRKAPSAGCCSTELRNERCTSAVTHKQSGPKRTALLRVYTRCQRLQTATRASVPGALGVCTAEAGREAPQPR